ncbi:hypothetical protein [Flavobacterium fluviatile]|uniref:hypothetical protein n=1 Tax=Flavobacterium fluviatile TaxID=1862387 RepID=UPI0013D7CFCC|nr:hypothetical protein [Flavobacterium fluviatile]
MKKIVLLFLLCCLANYQMQAQAKWRKELLLQIAALKVYIEYAQKGYSTVKKGLNFIGDLKKGELNLHSDYFTSLRKINPKIKKYYKVAGIISLQLNIIKISNNTFKELRKDDLFHGDEIDYIEKSFDRLFDNCNRTLDELLTVTTDSKFEMKDDERIKRIDILYKMMMDDFVFCRTFSNESKILMINRAKEKSDVKSNHLLCGL